MTSHQTDGAAGTGAARGSWGAWVAIGLASAGLLAAGAYAVRSETPSTAIAKVQAAQRAGVEPLPVIEVYKDANCGCCLLWVEHLREHGFTVEVTDSTDLGAVKLAYAIPGRLESCHTALVDGYVIEGHVPAVEVITLLAERPDIRGLAVPGMPIGSPGMEVQGYGVQPYKVVAFSDGGALSVFAQYGQ